MTTGRLQGPNSSPHDAESSTLAGVADSTLTETEQDEANRLRIRILIKRMRIQIWAGTITGFVVALAIGGAFIAVVSFLLILPRKH